MKKYLILGSFLLSTPVHAISQTETCEAFYADLAQLAWADMPMELFDRRFELLYSARMMTSTDPKVNRKIFLDALVDVYKWKGADIMTNADNRIPRTQIEKKCKNLFPYFVEN